MGFVFLSKCLRFGLPRVAPERRNLSVGNLLFLRSLFFIKVKMDNQQLQRKETMTSLVNNEDVMSAAIEMLNPKDMAALKQKVTTMVTDKSLLKCTPESILVCALEAVRLSLPLSAGQGYIVPYKGQAQLDIGYKGWQLIAKRNSFSVLADIVTDIDLFEQIGYGHNLNIKFEASNERQMHDDAWLKKHATHIIVSVQNEKTKFTTDHVVEMGMIFKIMGMSPSSSYTSSPYKNWFYQMIRAKAIKHILSRQAFDTTTSLQSAINISNDQEINRQDQDQADVQGLEVIDDHRFFNDLLPKYKNIMANKGKTAAHIIAMVSKKAALKPEQIQAVFNIEREANALVPTLVTINGTEISLKEDSQHA